ncbi:MAG: YceI family protein [Gammaproteobacteria bacterium]
MRRLFAAAALGALLAGCAAPSLPPSTTSGPAPVIAPPYQAAAQAGRPVYRLDSAASEVRILVGRAGPLASKGHVHVVEAAQLSGYALTAKGGGQADIVFPLNALVVDAPAARAALGGLYAEPLTPDQRKAIRAHMLSREALDSARYPWAHLHIVAPATAQGAVKITIALTLHGVTRVLPATTQLSLDARQLLASGTFTMRQSDFGITPYSVLLGALKVADPLDIRYHLAFDRWCPKQPQPTC